MHLRLQEFEGEGFFAAKLSDIIGMARKFSLWPLPFATSCCGIEFMATMAPNYHLFESRGRENQFLAKTSRYPTGLWYYF